MSVTVKHLRDYVFSALEITLVAGSDGLDREVSQVTVMETVDFSKGARARGLFVLTTLYTVTLDYDATIENIYKLFQNQLAGMCIKLNRYLSAVPDEIMNLAEQFQVPVFIVNRDFLFSDLIEKLSSVLANEKTLRMQFLFGQHEVLMRAIAKGKSIESVLGILSKAFGTRCCLIPIERKLLMPSYENGKWEEVEKLRSVVIEKSLLLSEETIYFFEENFCIFPCKISRRLLGCFVIEGISTVNDSEVMLLGQALAYLSIQLYERFLSFSKPVQYQLSVLDDILNKRHSSDWAVLEQLKRLGYEPEEYYAVLVASIRPEHLERYGYNLIEFCRLQLKSLFERAIEKTELGQLVMIVSFSKESPFLKNGELASVIDCFCASKMKNNMTRLDFGISLISTDLRELPDCYEQAKVAVRQGRIEQQGRHVHDYTVFMVCGLLNAGKGSPEYRWILNEIVVPLSEYDLKKESHLWETLGTLFRGDSLKDAAEQLFIHISTLRYRIEKIKQITELDYFTSDGRYRLYTAYIIYKENVRR